MEFLKGKLYICIESSDKGIVNEDLLLGFNSERLVDSSGRVHFPNQTTKFSKAVFFKEDEFADREEYISKEFSKKDIRISELEKQINKYNDSILNQKGDNYEKFISLISEVEELKEVNNKLAQNNFNLSTKLFSLNMRDYAKSIKNAESVVSKNHDTIDKSVLYRNVKDIKNNCNWNFAFGWMGIILMLIILITK